MRKQPAAVARRSGGCGGIVPLILALTFAAVAQGETKTFSTTSGAWLTAGNWTPSGLPTSADDVLISGGTNTMTITGAAGGTVDVSIAWLTYTNGSSRILENSSGTAGRLSTLTLNAVDANGHLINMVPDSGTPTFTIRNGGTNALTLVLKASGNFNVTAGTLLISSEIAQVGTQGFTKTGAGSVRLSGTNSFTGGITLNAGTVEIHSAGALNGNALTFTGDATLSWNSASTGPSPGTVSIGNGVTASFSTNSANPVFNQAVSGQGSFAKLSAAKVIVPADNTYVGTTHVAQGSLQIGNGGTAGTLGGGDVTLGTTTSSLIFNRGALAGTYNVGNRINGVGAVQLLGAGTISLNNAQSGYAGATMVSNGTLMVGANVANGWGITNSNINTTTDVITIAGNNLIDGDQVVISGGSIPGGLTAGTIYYVVNKAGQAVQLATTPGGTPVDITTAPSGGKVIGKVGALGATNAAVQLGNTSTLGSDTIRLLSSAGITFERQISVNDFGDSVTIGGSIDATTTFTNTITLNRSVTLTSAAVSPGAAVIYDGDISGGFDVAVAGVGKTRFVGNKSYGGVTTIAAGATLQVNGTLASTAVGVSGTLGGTGTIAAGVNATGGTIAPGVDGVGILATGSVTFTGGSFAADINVQNVTADLLAISGDLALDVGTSLLLNDVAPGAPLPLETKLTLITYSGAWNSTTFAGLADDSEFNFGTNRFLINYNDANAVTLTAVPEPAGVALAAIGSARLLLRRRKT